MTDVTRILNDSEQGDPHAAEQLLPLVYDELRKLAAQRLAQEKPGQTLEATSGPVVVGDFNGDGHLDLATDDGGVYLGNGDGTFQIPTGGTGRDGGAVVLGDFNGDGHLDHDVEAFALKGRRLTVGISEECRQGWTKSINSLGESLLANLTTKACSCNQVVSGGRLGGAGCYRGWLSASSRAETSVARGQVWTIAPARSTTQEDHAFAHSFSPGSIKLLWLERWA
jgi:hypothetical protein